MLLFEYIDSLIFEKFGGVLASTCCWSLWEHAERWL